MIGMPLERAALSLPDQGLSNERRGSSRPTDCRSTLRSARPTFWFAQSRWLRRPSSRPATRSHGYCRARPGSEAGSRSGVRTETRSRRTIPRNRRTVPRRHSKQTAGLAIATAKECGVCLHAFPATPGSAKHPVRLVDRESFTYRITPDLRSHAGKNGREVRCMSPRQPLGFAFELRTVAHIFGL
jgi:hypothetical protein